MDNNIKKILNVVVIIAILVYLLNLVGVLGSSAWIHFGRWYEAVS